jgi:hypothetical protein
LFLYTPDERSLGLGVGLAVLAETRGERSLQRHILICQSLVFAQPVTKVQEPLELCTVIHQMEVVAAIRSPRIAQKTPVGESRIECPWILVAAAVYESSDRRVEIIHERHHVDNWLSEEPRDCSGANVMDLQGSKQRRKPFALGLEGSRPRRVIPGELNEPITDTGAREILFRSSATIDLAHQHAVSQTLMDRTGSGVTSRRCGMN